MNDPVIPKPEKTGTTLPDSLAIASNDFAAVDRLIHKNLYSDVPLVNLIGEYLVEAGGKRLRPLLVLLTSGALAYREADRLSLAAIIEYLHTATLLHDDVVDESSLRRGQATANEHWGNAPSVLVGDFLYSRAFQLLVHIGHMPVMQILADATNCIAEGEVLQLTRIGNADLTEAEYFEVIYAKTARLFEAASHSAAALAGADATVCNAMKKYGAHLGNAFQLVDDYLDYAGDAATMGKNQGDDLAEGKVTLPLIEAMRSGSPAQAAIIRDAIDHRSAEQMPEVLAIVQGTGALGYTRQRAEQEADQARACLAALPHSAYRDSLDHLCQMAVKRNS